MNFRRILSKSSNSSGKSSTHFEDVSKLHAENESLKKTIESLKISLESRDAAIGTLAREKESIYQELRYVQRTNRNLHQQLEDERDFHAKEKEYFIEEIKKISKNAEKDNDNICLNTGSSNHSITEELKAKDEVICNICSKYLKMKDSKRMLQKRIEKIQIQCEKACQKIILLLQENRITLDNILRKFISSTVFPPNTKQYIKLLKVNANLHYENIQLKIRLSEKEFLEKNIIERGSSENHKTGYNNLFMLPYSQPSKGVVNRLKRFKFTNVTETRTSDMFSLYFQRKQSIFKSISDPCLLIDYGRSTPVENIKLR